MSSLRRLAKSPFWIACFTLPDGTRTNRSTKTTDRRVAQRIADEWQMAADRGRAGRLVEDQTRALVDEILVRTGQAPLFPNTSVSFLRRWLDGKTTAGTNRRYTGTVEMFLKHIRDKRSRPVDAISYEDILGFVAEREAQGASSRTIRVDVKILAAAFNVARKLGFASSNPVERALVLRPITVESNRRACFTLEQITTLLASAQGDWKTMILLGYFTGARLSDCANIRWQNVDLAAGLIDYLPQKTRRNTKRIVVPIHPTLLSHLKPLPAKGATYLCPNLANTTTGGKYGLSAQFNRIMSKAGIDPRLVRDSAIRRFHDDS